MTAAGERVPLEIETGAGRIRGRREAGLTAWRGVPYARPPVGLLRFRSPLPLRPWTGVRDATADGPLPPQPLSSRLVGASRRTPTDEDCLTLTVVRRTRGSARKPVMVFVYGGAFGIGGATASAYTGESLAAHGDVIFVGFNYRLGALGWLDCSRYSTAERPIESNVGLRDQLAALTWVRDNIAAFGGDPADVTLFGESAGGTAVLTLLAVPAARGLFARAAVESAAVGSLHAQQRAAGWAEELVADLPGTGAAALLAASAQDLVDATARLDERVSDRQPGARILGPVVDGDLVPDYPLDLLRRGQGHPVPLLIGTNADEGTLFQRFRALRALRATPVRVERLFSLTEPAAQEPVLAAYPGRRRKLARMVTDLMFWHSSVAVAAGHAQVAPVWMYRFDFAPPAMRIVGLGASHGAELDHVFARPRSPVQRFATSLGGRRGAREVTRRMSGAWIAFARTGRPPAWWPRFDAQARETFVFDVPERVEADPAARVRAAWDAWRPYG